jgi:putative nucleotidyltransferase-like protein
VNEHDRAHAMEAGRELLVNAMILERTSADVVGALVRAAIPSVLLKGPLQQRWLAPAGRPRRSGDVDVIVSPLMFDAAAGVLQSLGYALKEVAPEEPGREHAHVWVAPRRMPVELHFSLVGAPNAWNVLQRECETVEVMGQPVNIPNEAARCMIVALHAAQHGVGERPIFHDLEKALRVADPAAWRLAYELAAEAGGSTPFAAALALTPEGMNTLAASGSTPPELSDREALGLLTPAPSAVALCMFSIEPGYLAKARFVVGKLAPSQRLMRLRYPIARRGPLGMALAYLYRPLWLLRRLPRATWSWRRARRFAGASRTPAWQTDPKAQLPG